MTDDEVLQWLSEEERERFHLTCIAVDGSVVRDFGPDLRSLAETRAALAEDEWGDCGHVSGERECHRCDALESAGHRPTCIFASMPRPK
jgi:hypothetical protein